MSYTHLTQEDRVVLGALWRAGHTAAAISRQLHKHRATIGRELRRNRVPNKSGYDAKQARLLTQARRVDANQRCRKLTHHRSLQRKIERKLKRGWSPEQIAHWCGAVSHITIYRWVYEERQDLKHHLRSRKRTWRRRHGTAVREAWRERQKKRWIETRPKVVNKRRRLGDWEGDTVVGTDRKSAILVHVERKSGYVALDKLEQARAETVRQKTRQRFARLPKYQRRTITYDNGPEFTQHEFIERETKAKVYFAHPYSSWERGTCENTNGLLRQYVPKKTALTEITQSMLDRFAFLLNTRPRKRLNWRTPAQVLKQKCCT